MGKAIMQEYLLYETVQDNLLNTIHHFFSKSQK